jgi:hypothetical protein
MHDPALLLYLIAGAAFVVVVVCLTFLRALRIKQGGIEAEQRERTSRERIRADTTLGLADAAAIRAYADVVEQGVAPEVASAEETLATPMRPAAAASLGVGLTGLAAWVARHFGLGAG